MYRRFAPLALLALLPACERPERFVNVETTPAGAQCEAIRNGSQAGTAGPTPAVLGVTKSARPMTLTCTAPGHIATSTFIRPTVDRQELQKHQAISPALGTIVGVMSGAAMFYPPEVSLALMPDHFASEEKRDAAFAVRREEARQFYEWHIRLTKSGCPPNDVAYCRPFVEPIEAERDAMMQRLDEQQRDVRIEG